MKILSIRTLPGPNIWHHKGVLVMRLDLGELGDVASNEIPGFIDRLLDALPGVAEHSCDTGERGRFLERLHRGTYLAHICEHCAIEMTNLAGMGVSYGKARWAGEGNVYNVIVRYKAEHATRYLLRQAVSLLEALLAGKSFDLATALEEAAALAAEKELGPSTRAIVDAAERRGIPWRRLNEQSLVQLGYGVHRKLIQAAMSSQTSAIAMEIAQDKDMTKQLLRDAFVPLPESRVVYSADEAVEAWQDMGAPIVLKPLKGSQGRGVSLNLRSEQQVRCAYEAAEAAGYPVLAEEYLQGKDYRLLVVNGRLVAASQRDPAQVRGDGIHTIQELIDIENRNPLRGVEHEKPLTCLRVDPVALAALAKQGYTLGSVPKKGQKILLRENANLSTGGTARDVTGQVHPDTVAMVERATRLIGLDICGIDLVAPDIAKPLGKGGGIVELNAAPGLRMHEHPSSGKPRAAGEAIVDMLFPPGMPSRIPIVAITGSNGKTTVTRMIGHVLATSGYTVGMTTTDAIYVGGRQITEGDMTGPASARAVLGDPAVEVAVLETARGGMMRGGLGWDWADVGIITNIQADHIGQDGIEDVDDLVFVKSLVAERVREGGTLILNADDPNAAGVAGLDHVRKTRRKLVYFSLQPDNRLVQAHKAAGEVAYYVRDGWIIEANGAAEKKITEVRAVPATLGGAAQFNVANTLAAVAATRAMGLPPAMVYLALSRFDINGDNPGRMNLYQVGQGYVMVDYGHNPAALANVAGLVEAWKADGRRVTGILGLPGDRADWVSQEAARTAARVFDRLILREDENRRGRKPGEMIGLMLDAVRQERPGLPCTAIANQVDALEHTLATMEPGEVSVLFYDEIEPVTRWLGEVGTVPAPMVGQAIALADVPRLFKFSELARVEEHLD